jgi:hypothetical protein
VTDHISHPDPELCQFIEDVVWKSDREYFEARPGRSYRVRPAWDAEIRDHDLLCGDPPMPPLPLGQCWWVAVFQGLPGMRARVIFQGSHQFDIDPPEQRARSVFKSCERQQPKVALLAKTLRKMRRDPKFKDPMFKPRTA